MTHRELVANTSLLLLAFMSGCGTLETYPGPERPDAEIATLDGYKRFYFVYWEQADISSVDGRRLDSFPWSTSSVQLLPGRHWIEITQQRYFGGGGGYTVCAFERSFEAQHRYQLKAHSNESEGHWDERPPVYKGSMSIEVSAPNQSAHIVNVPTLCAQGSPSFCRHDTDCSHHPNYHCQIEPDITFGVCESRDR